MKPFLSRGELDRVFPVLKKGIKTAEKIVVEFDKPGSILPDEADLLTGDCAAEISIPIGVHGAKNVQNLSLGGQRDRSCFDNRANRFR